MKQKLEPSNMLIKKECKQKSWLESPSPDRWKNRSRTSEAMAEQMALQWGKLL